VRGVQLVPFAGRRVACEVPGKRSNSMSLPRSFSLASAGGCARPSSTQRPKALEAAYDAKRCVVAVTTADGEAIVRVLEDCPDELAEPRGVLLR
jgi:hypothetical protein